MQIVFLDTKTVGDTDNLKELNELGEVTFYPVTAPEQTVDRIKKADVVITNKVVLDGPLIRSAAQLKLICIAATGMNNVDLEAAENLGIPVLNVSGYAANSVAQATFAMILHLLQGVPFYDHYVKSGEYSKSDIFTNHDRPFWELRGKRFGIIGMGTIGRKVATVSEAFGCEVVYFSTSGKNSGQRYMQLSVKELLVTSDIVSIHAPLNQNTEGLIGYEEISKMKNHALLINTGRGGIILEADLAKALDEDLIAGAALDVFDKEPISADNPLLKVKKSEKLIMVPHIAWASIEARSELINGVIENIKSLISDH
jgi:glycerate dehydrogenase